MGGGPRTPVDGRGPPARMDLRIGPAQERGARNPAAEVVPNSLARNGQSTCRGAIGRDSALVGGRDERPLAGREHANLHAPEGPVRVRQHYLEQGTAGGAGGLARPPEAGLPQIKRPPGN